MYTSLPLGQYFLFKVFGFFRDRSWDFIKSYMPLVSKDPSNPFEPTVKEELRHIFLAPESLARQKSFQVQGVASPFICLWRTSALTWDTEFGDGRYGHSVLPRDISYIDPETNKEKVVRAFSQGYTFDLQLYAQSYFQDFVDKFNFNLLELDRLRCFKLDFSELIPGETSQVELLLKGIDISDTPVTATEGRSFNLKASYRVHFHSFTAFTDDALIRINLYLNGEKIWSSPELIPSPPSKLS